MVSVKVKKKMVRIVWYGPPLNQSNYEKASQYQLPFNKRQTFSYYQRYILTVLFKGTLTMIQIEDLHNVVFQLSSLLFFSEFI